MKHLVKLFAHQQLNCWPDKNHIPSVYIDLSTEDIDPTPVHDLIEKRDFKRELTIRVC